MAFAELHQDSTVECALVGRKSQITAATLYGDNKETSHHMKTGGRKRTPDSAYNTHFPNSQMQNWSTAILFSTWQLSIISSEIRPLPREYSFYLN